MTKYLVDTSRLAAFTDRVQQQLLGHILPFWTGPAMDYKHGGWQAWLTNDLKSDPTKPKGLIVNSRILWTFSAVHRARPEPLFRQMADRAWEVVMNRFWDAQHGGAYWRLSAEGQVLDDSKKIYGQAFYVYSLSEYFLAFGTRAALDRAIAVFELIERHGHDSLHGGYWEVRQRDWSEAADTRLSEKDMNEKKSMNNHLHVLEAYTNLYRAWPDPRVAQRLRELIALFLDRILDRHTNHFHHFFDEQWKVRSDSYTFGHDIEGSWLLCEAAEVLDGEAGQRSLQRPALAMARAVLKEGLDQDGGLFYEGRGGQIIDRGKEGWPQAEAVVGFLNAWQLSGEKPQYLEAAMKVWDFIEKHLVDRVHGEWFWRITPDGAPDSTLPKVSEWKGPYHASRCCLETLRRLNQLKVAPTRGTSAD